MCINCLEKWSTWEINFMWSVNNATKCTNNQFPRLCHYYLFSEVTSRNKLRAKWSTSWEQQSSKQNHFFEHAQKKTVQSKIYNLGEKVERVCELTIIHDTKLWWLFLDVGLWEDKVVSFVDRDGYVYKFYLFSP